MNCHLRKSASLSPDKNLCTKIYAVFKMPHRKVGAEGQNKSFFKWWRQYCKADLHLRYGTSTSTRKLKEGRMAYPVSQHKA